MDKEIAEKSIFRKENEILENSEEVVRKIEDVIKSENTTKESLLSEYIKLSEQYKKLLKVSKKITNIGDMNQRKLFEAYEKIQQQSIEIEAKNVELYKTSITDYLTKQHNRGYLLEVLSKEWSRAKRHKSGLSCIFIDIDFFKRINDTYGHVAGDYILINSSEIIKKCLRHEDIFGRYGGEEFMVILPNAGIEEAKVVSEKIRMSIEQHEFFISRSKIKITLSCGIACIDEGEPKNMDVLINHADLALYEAKRRGRNNTVLFALELLDSI